MSEASLRECRFVAAENAKAVLLGNTPPNPEKPFIGSALTVKLSPGNIVDWLPIFDIVESGDVVVIDAFGESETSIWGGLMAGLARAAGVAGAVIDGSARDIDEARMLDFPVISKSVSPRAPQSARPDRDQRSDRVRRCTGIAG